MEPKVIHRLADILNFSMAVDDPNSVEVEKIGSPMSETLGKVSISLRIGQFRFMYLYLSGPVADKIRRELAAL